jgi:hypothetical protein
MQGGFSGHAGTPVKREQGIRQLFTSAIPLGLYLVVKPVALT